MLLNRELSDDVREWDVAFGVARPESMTGRVFHGRGAKETEEWKIEHEAGRLYNVHQGPASDGGRNSPAEGWMWRFEQGFIQPFLETSCSVVDRATIVRLSAARSARTGVEYTGIAAKKVEMDARPGLIRRVDRSNPDLCRQAIPALPRFWPICSADRRIIVLKSSSSEV